MRIDVSLLLFFFNYVVGCSFFHPSPLLFFHSFNSLTLLSNSLTQLLNKP